MIRVLRVVGGALAASLVGFLALGSGVGAAAPTNPNIPPSIQAQMAEMTPSQLAFFNAKMTAYQSMVASRSGTSTQAAALSLPVSRYEYMATVLEGGNDSWCGPATAQEMYSTFHYYWPSVPYIQQQQAYNEIVAAGYWHNGTDLGGVKYEMNHHQSQNPYVLGHVAGPADVHDLTQLDIGGYYFPVAYDGLTNGYYANPLYPQYVNVSWYHWFPAYGYNATYMYVADPHFNAKYSYTSTAIYDFIYDFLGGTNAVITW